MFGKKSMEILILISKILVVLILLTSCHKKSKIFETRNNVPVNDNEILHVDINEEEENFVAVYMLNETNEFKCNFISKYDIGKHTKNYKVKLKIEYLDNTQIIDYMEIPNFSKITKLYVTMENYHFITALFDDTQLISKGAYDISVLNKEDKPLKCMAGSTDKTHIIGFGQQLSNNLVVYKTELSVIHGDEEWNEENDEKMTLSVIGSVK